MNKKLDKAPLVQALIHLRFAEVPALKSPKIELQTILHQCMVDEGFPEKINSKTDITEWQFDTATQQMKHKQTSRVRVLFRAAGEKEIIEISESSIILKSTSYKTFNEFYDKFHRVLLRCLDVIPGLNKTLLKSVGLRYIDVIVPNDGSSLSDFVTNDVKPPGLLKVGKHLKGHSLKAIEIATNQVLIVNFEELPTLERRINKVLPDNLIEQDEKCGLIIDGQVEWFNVMSETYGILDIDHTYNFAGSPALDVASIESASSRLYQQASDIFWSVITNHAKQEWKYREL
jgi:uncharacterized protein (TIGR04255 family)